MDCFITQTGAFLPGPPVISRNIEKHLGSLDGEAEVKQMVLRMNGIVTRHYAQDENQRQIYDVYDLAHRAVSDCLSKVDHPRPWSFLAAGTTYSPLSGPGMGSIVHDYLNRGNLISEPVEISSHAGICTSASAALLSAIRAVSAGEHPSAICVGAEHPSAVLKQGTIQPIDDRREHTELRKSKWFMSVFLRFMLSDGAGAFCLANQPNESGLSFQVNWMFSRSFAHQAPLCMKLENRSTQLSQDISILQKHLFRCARSFVAAAMERHGDDLDKYRMVLPHLSSFFFRKRMERVMQEFSTSSQPVPYWTNLSTVGNTGSASIFIMLDEYQRTHRLKNGDRIMLFIPESGQFNFVLVSLTAVIK